MVRRRQPAVDARRRRSSSWPRRRAAASTGWRWSSGRNHGDGPRHRRRPAHRRHRVTVLFLDAQDADLVRRYDAARRKHPLDDARPIGLVEAIALERRLLRARHGRRRPRHRHVRAERPPAQGSRSSRRSTTRARARLQIAVESFGFKHGLPLDADIVMDVRFLPNPHWEEAAAPAHRPRPRRAGLRAGAGRHVRAFLDRLDDLLRTLLPAYEAEGRSYLTDRHRLHRRPPPLRRHRRGAGQPPPRPRHRRPHHPPRRRPVRGFVERWACSAGPGLRRIGFPFGRVSAPMGR